MIPDATEIVTDAVTLWPKTMERTFIRRRIQPFVSRQLQCSVPQHMEPNRIPRKPLYPWLRLDKYIVRCSSALS